MNVYKTLTIELNGAVAKIWLNRPEVHNALNATLITELLDVLQKLDEDQKIRIVVLSGKGKSFCAGADAKWMHQTQQMPFKENYEESLRLAKCFYALYNHSKITIAAVQGAAYGGGIGLICACDLAFSLKSVAMAFSEIKLGLPPATIAPYVILKIGQNKALELMLSGNSFNGHMAEKIGLVNSAWDESEFDMFLREYIHVLLNKAPQAQLDIKRLVNTFALKKVNRDLITASAEWIAKAKISGEAKEGIKAFLEKRQPNWMKS